MKTIKIEVNVSDVTYDRFDRESIARLPTTEVGLMAVEAAMRCEAAKRILDERGVTSQLQAQVQLANLQHPVNMPQHAPRLPRCSQQQDFDATGLAALFATALIGD